MSSNKQPAKLEKTRNCEKLTSAGGEIRKSTAYISNILYGLFVYDVMYEWRCARSHRSKPRTRAGCAHNSHRHQDGKGDEQSKQEQTADHGAMSNSATFVTTST